MQGVVKVFFPERGFGFITADQRSVGDVFVHARHLEETGLDELVKGDRVEFDVVPDRRGQRAANVRLADA